MKNLLLAAALFVGFGFAANAQDYSKNDKDVTQEAKHKVNKAGDAVEDEAKDVGDKFKDEPENTESTDVTYETKQKASKAGDKIEEGASDVKDAIKEDEPEKTQAERQNDQNDRSKAGKALHETGSTVGSGAKWTYDKAKHNKVTKNVFNQPGDE